MLEVWGTAMVGRSRSLDFFVGQIRAKLTGLPLQTVRGFGFRLDSLMGLRVRAVLVVLLLMVIAALAIPLALTLADRPHRGTGHRTPTPVGGAGGCRRGTGGAVAGLWSNGTDRCTGRACSSPTPMDGRWPPMDWTRPIPTSRRRPAVPSSTPRALRWSALRPWDGRRLLSTAAIRRDGEVVRHRGPRGELGRGGA